MGFAACPGHGEVYGLVSADRLEEQSTAASLSLGKYCGGVLPTCILAQTSLLQQYIEAGAAQVQGKLLLGCLSSCEGSTGPSMHRADGAMLFGPQISLILLLICLPKAALNQTCAIWMWLCLQPGVKENGLQRSEGDSDGAGP